MLIELHYPACFIFSRKVITGRTNQNKSCQNGFQDLMPTGKGDNENTQNLQGKIMRDFIQTSAVCRVCAPLGKERWGGGGVLGSSENEEFGGETSYLS